MTEHCVDHEKMVDVWHNIDKTTTALSVRINGSISDIEKHIERGNMWRVSICGLAVVLIVQIITTAFFMGMMVRQVEINTTRLNVLEKVSMVDNSVK